MLTFPLRFQLPTKMVHCFVVEYSTSLEIDQN